MARAKGWPSQSKRNNGEKKWRHKLRSRSINNNNRYQRLNYAKSIVYEAIYIFREDFFSIPHKSFVPFIDWHCAIEIQIILSSFSDFNPFWNLTFFPLAKSKMWEIINCLLFWATDHRNQLMLWVLTAICQKRQLFFVFNIITPIQQISSWHVHSEWSGVNERVIWCVDLIWFDSIRIIISMQFSIGQLIIDK